MLTMYLEGGLREGIMGTGKDLLERRKFTLVTSEDLGDLERLQYETLDLTGTLDLEVSLVTAAQEIESKYSQ